ncbi:hypothetical protein QZH41_012479, partial [Actinostola sp. cb2023]
AREGPCKTSKPAFWDFVGKAKWESWKLLEKMDKEAAMKNYIKKLFSVDPEWDIKYVTCTDKSVRVTVIIIIGHQVHEKQTMGFAVSTLRCGSPDEIISDANKTIFDWCKEGNVKRMDMMLSKAEDINTKDSQGIALLHWACDRGHEHVADYLIKNKADVNITVSVLGDLMFSNTD